MSEARKSGHMAVRPQCVSASDNDTGVMRSIDINRYHQHQIDKQNKTFEWFHTALALTIAVAPDGAECASTIDTARH